MLGREPLLWVPIPATPGDENPGDDENVRLRGRIDLRKGRDGSAGGELADGGVDDRGVSGTGLAKWWWMGSGFEPRESKPDIDRGTFLAGDFLASGRGCVG